MFGELSCPVKHNGKYTFLDTKCRLVKNISFDYIKESAKDLSFSCCFHPPYCNFCAQNILHSPLDRTAQLCNNCYVTPVI